MAIALIACSDSGVIEDSPAQITLEKNTVRVGCTVIGTATVKFHTTRDWVATLDDDCDWLTIAPTSGSAGDAKIVITSQPLPEIFLSKKIRHITAAVRQSQSLQMMS